jgi:hypothetical protein
MSCATPSLRSRRMLTEPSWWQKRQVKFWSATCPPGRGSARAAFRGLCWGTHRGWPSSSARSACGSSSCACPSWPRPSGWENASGPGQFARRAVAARAPPQRNPASSAHDGPRRRRSYTMAAAGLKSETPPYAETVITNTSSSSAAVILLSFVLAVGFLLIILSCALWSNWLPLLVGPSASARAPHPSSQLAHSPYLRPRPAPERALRPLRPRRLRRRLRVLRPRRHRPLPHRVHRRHRLRAPDRPRPLARHPPRREHHVHRRRRVRASAPPRVHERGSADRRRYRLVYGTILAYSTAFRQDESEFD